MKFKITEAEGKQARFPHDLFLTNLVANHILIFVSTLGLASSMVWPMLFVPIFSFSVLIFTLFRAKKSLKSDTWYVKCHWQLAKKRSIVFMSMLIIALIIVAIGLVLYTQFGFMKEAVFAFIGGAGILPVMFTVLILIIMESDALNQANHGIVNDNIVEKFPEGKYEEAE
ncbi:MAG: hypothetical protein ISR69_11405 [Gammaproteobacteria bacterium]|nr:hypothetical protein [Gammaproteobacteria bacterium]